MAAGAGWVQLVVAQQGWVAATEWQERAEQMEMVALSPLVKTALLVVLVVGVVEQAQVPCRMSGVDKAATSRRQHISMLDVEEISIRCGQEGISLASSRPAVC